MKSTARHPERRATPPPPVRPAQDTPKRHSRLPEPRGLGSETGQSATEFTLTLALVVIPLCPIVVRLVIALADYYDAQASLVSLPVP